VPAPGYTPGGSSPSPRQRHRLGFAGTMPITLLDIVLIAVMLVSGRLGFARGLIFLEWLFPQSSWPNWLQNSLLRRRLERLGQFLPGSWKVVDGRAAMNGVLVVQALVDLTIVSVFIDLLAVVSRRLRLRRFERKYHASIA
jgi:hypothetical protein